MTISFSPGPIVRPPRESGAANVLTWTPLSSPAANSGKSNGLASAKSRTADGIGAPGPGVQSPDASNARCSNEGRPERPGLAPVSGATLGCWSTEYASCARDIADWWSAGKSKLAVPPVLSEGALPASAPNTEPAEAPAKDAPVALKADPAYDERATPRGTAGASMKLDRAWERSPPTWISPLSGKGIDSSIRVICPLAP